MKPNGAMTLRRGTFGCAYLLETATDFSPHAHDRPEFIVSIAGARGRFRVGADEIIPGPTRAIVVDAFQTHSHALEGKRGLFLCILVDPVWLRSEYNAIVMDRGAIDLEPTDHHTIDEAVMEISARARDVRHCLALATVLVDRAFQRPGSPARRERPPDFRLRRAAADMKAHLDRPFDVDALAQRAGLSRARFFELFVQQMGMTPGLYWNTLRVNEAMDQLEHTSRPLQRIASQIGIDNAANFSRFFRDRSGVSPKTFREAMRQAR